MPWGIFINSFMKLNNYKGYLYAALAAAAYGTNPIFAKPCYADGMNPDTVLLFRYVLGLLLLAVVMGYNAWRKHNFRGTFVVNRHTLPQLILMGILMALSSLTLFVSYNYMPVGIASTLLFIYPILVAVIMTLCFHEKMSWLVVGCLLLATFGITLLCKGGEPTPDAQLTATTPDSPLTTTTLNSKLSTLNSSFAVGFLFVMLSSLSYAIYLVGLNKTRVRTIASMPVTLYVIFFGMFLFVGRLLMGTPLMLPNHPLTWLNLFGLGLFPTVVSLVLTAKAIQHIGSTQTALFGALEPVTAVVLGILLLGEVISLREFVGMVLIFVSVTLVMCRRR